MNLTSILAREEREVSGSGRKERKVRGERRKEGERREGCGPLFIFLNSHVKLTKVNNMTHVIEGDKGDDEHPLRVNVVNKNAPFLFYPAKQQIRISFF